MEKAEYIADLYELKKSLTVPLDLDYNRNYIQPNTTYTVIETLIAVFSDKYKVDYRDVKEVLRKRALNNLVIGNIYENPELISTNKDEI